MKKLFTAGLALFIVLSVCWMSISAEPENKLKNMDWVKFYNQSPVAKLQESGVDYWSAPGINSAWASPGLDIYPAVKAAIGKEDEVSVYIVFDARVKYTNTADNGKDYPCGILLRATGISADIKDNFKETYMGSAFVNSDGNVTCRFTTEAKISDQWTHFELQKDFTSDDTDDTFWTAWMLCLDRMTNSSSASALEFKNMGVYLEDEFSPTETEAPADGGTDNEEPATNQATPTPVIINTPVNFNKYGITFSTGVPVADANGSATPAQTNAAATKAATPTAKTEPKKTSAGLIIAVAIGAVVIVSAAVISCVLILKKRNEAPQDEEEEN